MLRLIILVLILNFSCTTVTIYNPHSDKNIILTHDVSQCYSKRIFKKWTAFYGAVALNKIDPNELFPTDNFAYRITEEATSEDALISFFLGLFTTISRKSIVVDFCTPPLETTKKDKDKKANSTPVTTQEPDEKIKPLQDVEKPKVNSKGATLNHPIFVSEKEEELANSLEKLEKKLDQISVTQRKIEDEINLLKLEDSLELSLNEKEVKSNFSNFPENDQIIYLKGKRKIIISSEDEPQVSSDLKKTENEFDSKISSKDRSKKVFLGSIYFPTNSYKLTTSARKRLQKILKSHKGKILLLGYADIRGNNHYNYLISKRRALAVRQEISRILGDLQVTISALGASKFKKIRDFTKLTQTDLDMQRRVDVVLLSE